MAAPNTTAVTPDTPIVIKISVNDVTKRLKLPLRDLSAAVLPAKLRTALQIDPAQHVVLERYSDSVGDYIVLDENNPQVYKTLNRAAKAKLKLRLKATVTPLTMLAIRQPDVFNTPTKPVQAQDSTPEQRNIGSGIFQFRDARASRPASIVDRPEEAPTPKPFVASLPVLERAGSQKLVIRAKESGRTTLGNAWSVYCNECDKALSNEHFHCSICDEGDYDLCAECVQQGKGCPGVDHWLIKRHIVDGKVIASTTERVTRKQSNADASTIKSEKSAAPAAVLEPITVANVVAARPSPVPTSRVSIESLLTPMRSVPGAFTEETKTLAEEPRTEISRMETRTCNSCVIILPEREFVTCDDCEDYDLCIKCHADDKHGHHPAHTFKPATQSTVLSFSSTKKLAAGRGVHHNAICDGCDKNITGVRHKCLNCSDWDYCGKCIQYAGERHAAHRFVAICEPIADAKVSPVCHINVMCDGPLCSAGTSRRYIYGVRYKCTICHDTDFCAACEAHPSNKHNITHPLLKLKTPVRNVSVSTENQVLGGQVRVLGDRTCPAAPAAEKASPAQTNSATPVQTVAEIKPIDLPVSVPVKKYEPFPFAAPQLAATSSLEADFVRDSIADGQSMSPGARFVQVWTMKNSGPVAWPAGCSVRYVGGDNMLDVDDDRSGLTAALDAAAESNVVARQVQPGEEVAFKVGLRAPKREGKAISYWRVKGPDGQLFGHKLWCDITVKKIAAPPAQPAATFDQLLASRPEVSAAHAAAQSAQDSKFTDALHRIQAQRQAMEMHRQQAQRQRMAEAAADAQRRVAAAQQHVTDASIQANLESQRRQMMGLTRLQSLHDQKKQELSRTDYLPKAPMMPASRPAYGYPPGLPPPYYGNYQPNMSQTQATPYIPSWAQPAPYPVPHPAPMMPPMCNYYRPTNVDNVCPVRVPPGLPPAPMTVPRMPSPPSAPAVVPAVTTKATTTASHDEYSRIQKILLEHAKNAAHEEDAKAKDTVDVEETEAGEENLERSSMVFPKLDKESPTSSTYQSLANSVNKGKAAYVENEKGEVEDVAIPAAATTVAMPAETASSIGSHDQYEEFDDELEVLSATGQESDDEEDGFATDEEYDILDASDEETVA